MFHVSTKLPFTEGDVQQVQDYTGFVIVALKAQWISFKYNNIVWLLICYAVPVAKLLLRKLRLSIN